jgi:hypothetical protein
MDNWKTVVQVPVEELDFPLLLSVQTSFGAHPASNSVGRGGSFPTVTADRTEADHPPAPSTFVHGTHRDNFNFSNSQHTKWNIWNNVGFVNLSRKFLPSALKSYLDQSAVTYGAHNWHSQTFKKCLQPR